MTSLPLSMALPRHEAAAAAKSNPETETGLIVDVKKNWITIISLAI
jgi:hypothetical protein